MNDERAPNLAALPVKERNRPHWAESVVPEPNEGSWKLGKFCRVGFTDESQLRIADTDKFVIEGATIALGLILPVRPSAVNQLRGERSRNFLSPFGE